MFGLENAYGKVVMVVEWKLDFSCHCSETVCAITPWILELKIWGLLFWIAYDVSYKFDVLRFCI